MRAMSNAPNHSRSLGHRCARPPALRWISRALGIYRELFFFLLLVSPLIAFWYKRSPIVVLTIWMFLLFNGILLRSPIIIATVVGAGLFSGLLYPEAVDRVLPNLRGRADVVLLSIALITVAAGVVSWVVFPRRGPRNADSRDPPPAAETDTMPP